ncbi:hypothetical protein, partial [Xanthomonas citri]|uniref:hypothetical protein n=1 Tax=Xanthomonas citri TaxID=346 RepID=UPI00054423A5|nr:membrane hypothetical protein [Xanthomonas citri pv. bilvae]
MQFQLMRVAILGLGAVSFIAITLIPLRGYLILRRYRQLLGSNPTGTSVYLVMMAVVLSAVATAGFPFMRVSGCLLDSQACHPNRSGGCFFLAAIGFVYLVLELLLFLLGRLGHRSQPNNSFHPTALHSAA